MKNLKIWKAIRLTLSIFDARWNKTSYSISFESSYLYFFLRHVTIIFTLFGEAKWLIRLKPTLVITYSLESLLQQKTIRKNLSLLVHSKMGLFVTFQNRIFLKWTSKGLSKFVRVAYKFNSLKNVSIDSSPFQNLHMTFSFDETFTAGKTNLG